MLLPRSCARCSVRGEDLLRISLLISIFLYHEEKRHIQRLPSRWWSGAVSADGLGIDKDPFAVVESKAISGINNGHEGSNGAQEFFSLFSILPLGDRKWK